MQTDPNWSNFLYEESERTINLIDFGAARDYPKRFVDDYLRMVDAFSFFSLLVLVLLPLCWLLSFVHLKTVYYSNSINSPFAFIQNLHSSDGISVNVKLDYDYLPKKKT